jgi:hypothetical protein
MLRDELAAKGWNASELGRRLIADQCEQGRRVPKSMRAAVSGWMRRGKIPRPHLREAIARVFGWGASKQARFYSACGRPLKSAA